MFLWTEPTAKRGSDEIASILLKYLVDKSALKDHLVVFTHNCGGQNKNWVVMLFADQKILKDLKRKYNGPITLNVKKIADLKKLLKHIPPISLQFFIDVIGDIASEAVVEDEQLSNDSVDDMYGDEEIHDME
nr:unnamed protein product [Callosobruchus analis]